MAAARLSAKTPTPLAATAPVFAEQATKPIALTSHAVSVRCSDDNPGWTLRQLTFTLALQSIHHDVHHDFSGSVFTDIKTLAAVSTQQQQ